MSDQTLDDLIAAAEAGDRISIQLLRERGYASSDHELRLRADRALAAIDPRVRVHTDGSVLIEIADPRDPDEVGDGEPHLPTFMMAQHPVTNRQFLAFIEDTGYDASHGTGDLLEHWSGGDPPQKILDHPVVHVSLLDAATYCAWAGLTLPSEVMWERAAAGPAGHRYPWGESPKPYPNYVNIRSESTTATGTYREIRTAYGCQDMLGNVSEWCVSHDDYDGDEPRGPLGPRLEHLDQRDPDELAKRLMAVRGSAYMRSGLTRIYCQHSRALRAGRRNHWVGFRVAYRPS